MPEPIGPDQIARLEARVASDPGAPEFAALCEALRRAGRLPEAQAVARRGLAQKPGSLEGALALALVLLDLGRSDEARRLLEARAADCLAVRDLGAPGVSDFDDASVDFGDEVTDGELERALASAEPDRDQLLDADRVAQVAMRIAHLDQPESDPASADPIFATRTMAELLARQGDSDGAARIREALADADVPSLPLRRVRGDASRIIGTLETWLHNLRRQSR